MTVLISAIVAAATVLFGYLTALRAQYERVLNVIDYISSSDIAEARHRLGLVIYGPPVQDEDIPDRAADLFTILWAFGRINAVRNSLPRVPHGFPRLVNGPQQLLRSNTESWAHFWKINLESVANKLNSPDVEGSDNGLKELADAWPLSSS